MPAKGPSPDNGTPAHGAERASQCDLCGRECKPEEENCVAVTCSFAKCNCAMYHAHCMDKYLKSINSRMTHRVVGTVQCPRGTTTHSPFFPERCRGKVDKPHPVVPKTATKPEEKVVQVPQQTNRQAAAVAAAAAAKKQQLPAMPRKARMASKLNPQVFAKGVAPIVEAIPEEPEDKGRKELLPGMTPEMVMTKAQRKNMRKKQRAKGQDGSVNEDGSVAAAEGSLGDSTSDWGSAMDFGGSVGSPIAGAAASAAEIMGANAFVSTLDRYNALLGIYLDSDEEEEYDGQQQQQQHYGQEATHGQHRGEGLAALHSLDAGSPGSWGSGAGPSNWQASPSSYPQTPISPAAAPVPAPALLAHGYANGYAARYAAARNAAAAAAQAAGSANAEVDFEAQLQQALAASEAEAKATLAKQLVEEQAALKMYEQLATAQPRAPAPAATPQAPAPAAAAYAPAPALSRECVLPPGVTRGEAVERLVSRMFEAPAFADMATRFLGGREQRVLGDAAEVMYPELVIAIDRGDVQRFEQLLQEGERHAAQAARAAVELQALQAKVAVGGGNGWLGTTGAPAAPVVVPASAQAVVAAAVPTAAAPRGYGAPLYGGVSAGVAAAKGVVGGGMAATGANVYAAQGAAGAVVNVVAEGDGEDLDDLMVLLQGV